MRSKFAELMKKELSSNDQSCLLLGDIGVRSFENELLQYPSRVINVGILEQSMVGIGAGLSLAGYIPTIHTIAPFMILRAFEQIKIDFGYQELSGNLVSVGASIDYSALGTTHHCPEDITVLNTIPNIELLIPGNSFELENLLSHCFDNSKLTYIRLSELENSYIEDFDFGKINVIKRGKSATVLAVGPMLEATIYACSELDVTVLYCNVLKPFDANTLVNNLIGGKLVIVEPFFTNSTHGVLLDHGINFVDIKITSIGLPLKYFKKYGSLNENLIDVGLDRGGLREQILGIIYE
jgi:transketolase